MLSAWSSSTTRWSDASFCFYNFEWLAFPGFDPSDLPRFENRLLKIPISIDDSQLRTREADYDAWERAVLSEVERRPFAAIGLGAGGAEQWLPHYERLLDRLGDLGRVQTLDQYYGERILSAAG